MYSLSVEQRKQFQESGIAREFRGQAEEKWQNISDTNDMKISHTEISQNP